ncbi:MAG: hypothetical protein AAFR52_05605 [Pseudomonadota bacterium]
MVPASMGREDGTLSVERVSWLFTRADGSYRFARWGRPLVPALFGGLRNDERMLQEATASVGALGGLSVAPEDPDLGANFLVFTCKEWSELRRVPGMERLVPDIHKLTTVLEASGANQYRIFGFEPDTAGRPGAIRVCVTLLRMDDVLSGMGWRVLAPMQVVHAMVLWSDTAFIDESPVDAVEGTGRALVKPWVQTVIRTAYDPGLPDHADNPAHAGDLVAMI